MTAHPDNSDYALGLANALYDGGDTAGALTPLESFLERYPSNSAVRLQYAALLGYSKQYAAAIGQYNQVLEFDPANVVAEVGVAKVTSWQGHLGCRSGALRQNPPRSSWLVRRAGR